jgi:hypothetical protein
MLSRTIPARAAAGQGRKMLPLEPIWVAFVAVALAG